jgi:putative transposase
VPHDTRDAIVDYVRDWSCKSDIPVSLLLRWVGITTSKYHDWKKRFGKVNEHNASVPRDHWLTDDEKARIHTFARAHPLEGYRRLTFMMLDADVVACSPASAYRVLRKAGLLAGPTPNVTKKGTGYVQPLSSSGVARRCQLPQHRRYVLFLMRGPGWLQPLHRPLGNPPKNGGNRRGNHSATRP